MGLNVTRGFGYPYGTDTIRAEEIWTGVEKKVEVCTDSIRTTGEEGRRDVVN